MTTTTVMNGLLAVDDKGVVRIAGSRIRVIDIAMDERAYGLTAEGIQQEHPHLSLAQVHAALAYYHQHKAELDDDIERRRVHVEAMRAAAPESPLVKRLRAEGKL